MEYRYRINPNLRNQSFTLQDVLINIQPGRLYNLDARCGGDAQAKSGELRNAMSKGWIQRVQHEEPRKIKAPKVEVKPKVEIPEESTPEEIKAEKIFNTAVDLGVIETTDKGFECESISGKGKSKFKTKDRAIERMATEPELMAHIQKLCQG